MPITLESRHLGDVVVLTPRVLSDERGYFMETYRSDEFEQLGLPGHFVQDNHSHSKKGVLRGLHFQWEPPMGKLMRVTRGAAFLVAVDIRKGSPTLAKWFGLEVSISNKKQVWAPAGFARAGRHRARRGGTGTADRRRARTSAANGSPCWDPM